jgi:hypothetical protein
MSTFPALETGVAFSLLPFVLLMAISSGWRFALTPPE